MSDLIIERLTLGQGPWPTLDPFLFCVHHNDAYPAANEAMGPAASLHGRRIGMDFDNVDGWNMYHGATVPGFPAHPHRGFETVTFARRGLIDHSDSLGAAARFGRGDTQWMTAGAGIVHAEMFPLLDTEAPNPAELFQIWLNLPAEDKRVEPHFAMLWTEDIPRVVTHGTDGAAATVTVIAGRYREAVPPPPPPHSWASRPDADVAIWHISLEPGATSTLPAATGTTLRTVYVFEGDALTIGDESVRSGTGAVVPADRELAIAGSKHGAPTEALVLQGRPISEPVAQHGPFVMNNRAELEQAFADYRATGFGGWPWPAPDPVHGRDPARFARHADGNVQTAPGGRTTAPPGS